MFHSSIFSFNTLHIKGWLSVGRIVALITAIVLISVAEVMARVALKPTGEYWEYWNKKAGDKYIWYRGQRERGVVPRVLMIGDSTAARNFNPMPFEVESGATAFNLGWPANFPLALEQSTVPLLEGPMAKPAVVLFSVSPKAFTDHELNALFEAPILASPAARHYRGEWLVSDYCYLTRLNAARDFSSGWFDGSGLFQMPTENGAMLLDGRERTPDETSLQADEFDSGGLSQKRLAVLEKIAEVATDGKFELIVIIPPREIEERRITEEEYMAHVEQIVKPRGFSILDCRRLEFLTSAHFFDPMHLNRDGAALFSRYIAQKIQEELELP